MGNTVRASHRGRHVNRFNATWWAGRPGWGGPAWRHQRYWGRYPARYWWRAATAAAVTGWFVGWWREPAYFYYGDTVYYQDDSVYYGDQAVATADEYYAQAATIAESAPQVDDEKAEWLPLGVFALTQPDTEASNMVLQLAVSKEGVIAGTFFNETTDTSHPVEGLVDKESQRAAWRSSDGTNPNLVMETGIYNLTKDEAPVLVHFSASQSQSWLMVRLPEPEAEGS